MSAAGNRDGTLTVQLLDGRQITLLPGEWSSRLVPHDPETTAVFRSFHGVSDTDS